MRYTKIELPWGGFQDGDPSSPILYDLEVCVGERQESNTALHVRGMVLVHPRGNYQHFAGVTLLREGRDEVSHDIKLFGSKERDERDEEAVAIAVHLALDEHGGALYEQEMKRICADPPKEDEG